MPEPLSGKQEDDSDSGNELYYVPDKWYSITINPSEKYQHFGHPNRLTKFENEVSEVFRGCAEHVEFLFYVELSEPRGNLIGSVSKTTGSCNHQGSRLHIHGIFRLIGNNGVREFLLTYMYKWLQLGFTNIDTCDDMDKWERYCKKQQVIMRLKPWTNRKESLLKKKNIRHGGLAPLE